jgi:hypothetical protein
MLTFWGASRLVEQVVHIEETTATNASGETAWV